MNAYLRVGVSESVKNLITGTAVLNIGNIVPAASCLTSNGS